jgi:hypothetical protein
MFQNRFLKAYNAGIGARLARWLVPARAQKAPKQHPDSHGTTDL